MDTLTPAVTQASFQQEVLDTSQREPVLVDFWAAWCGPCKALAPLLENVAAAYAGRARVVKVDTDRDQELAAQYGIRSLPTVMLFKDGRPVDQVVGLQPEAQLRAFVDAWLDKPSDGQRAEARSLLAAGHPEAAVQLLMATKASEPGNEGARVELAEALAAAGRVDEAQAELDGLPASAMNAPRLAAAQARLHFARAVAGAPALDELRRRVAAEPGDLVALHQLGARELQSGRFEEALDHFAGIMHRDRQFGDDLARQSMLHAFALLEDRDELVHQYRRRMAALMH